MSPLRVSTRNVVTQTTATMRSNTNHIHRLRRGCAVVAGSGRVVVSGSMHTSIRQCARCTKCSGELASAYQLTEATTYKEECNE